MDKKISELFDYGEGIELTGETPHFDPAEIRAMTLERLHPKHRVHAVRKTARTLLFAAVIASLLGATAFALGLSIHRQRQEEIRSKLRIDENHVEDYVEYPVPEEPQEAPAEGATLLSTMNDGEFQRLWVLLSGVTPEMIDSIAASEQVDWDETPLGLEDHRYRWVVCTLDGESFFDTDTVAGHSIREGYDAESQTLTLRAWVLLEDLPEGEPVSLRFVLADFIDYDDGHSEVDMVGELGSVEVRRTGQTTRSLWFPEPIPFENPELGGSGEFLGVEISATGLNWYLRHDGMDQMYRPRSFATEEERLAYREFEISWLHAIEAVERDATLNFADGSTRDLLVPLRTELMQGMVKDICGFGNSTIDITQAVSVTIGGVTIPFA